MKDFAVRTVSARELRDLEAEITTLAGHLNAGEYRFLELLSEFDRRAGWSDSATHSCAHWLNWKCGIDLGAARERVRVAHAVEKLPRIAAAMARGELSYSKVRALTRVAGKANEEYFLSIALHGTAHQVETLVRCYRRAQEAEELSREARQQENRELSYYHDSDGSLVLKGRLPADVGALVLKALDAAVKSMSDVSAETSSKRPRLSVRRADALGRIAESFLAHGEESLAGGDRHQIVVHVDAGTLEQRTGGRSELEEGPSIAAETARRLACEASVIRIVEGQDGEPLDVGRKTRSIPPAIRRALKARDQGCRFPGCTHARFVDGHHIHHWANGGETKLSNLVLLCRFHHRAVHEGQVRVQFLDDGALRFVRDSGETFDSLPGAHTQTPSDWRELAVAHCAQKIRIEAPTAVTRWRGEPMDYDLGVDVLLQQAGRTRAGAMDVSAAT